MGNKQNKLIVIGASGHAKVVIDILERQDVNEIAFVVDDNRHWLAVRFSATRLLGRARYYWTRPKQLACRVSLWP
jgi:hypothetical protein